MEYIAVFIAILFPGALVAFNFELLQSLPRFAALRIYCAGIWHNAVCCAVCVLALFLLPLILFPFYLYGESPMVLNISSASPLSQYLSPGDVIVSLDGTRIHDSKQWMELTGMIHEQTLEKSNHSKYLKDLMKISGRKGYCVPSSMLEESQKVQLEDDQFICPKDLTAFLDVSCLNSSVLDKDGDQNREESGYCLAAQNIVKLNKCCDGWVMALRNRSNCLCSQDENCVIPVHSPGLTWVEITYSSPNSLECLRLDGNVFPGYEASGFGEISCGGTFVFVGDVLSMAHSVHLTAYQPRWPFAFNAYIPTVMEKILMSTYHVSLTLSLLNSLPVYFLDGESILEVTLCYLTFLNQKRRGLLLQAFLLGGTLISILVFLRIFLLNRL